MLCHHRSDTPTAFSVGLISSPIIHMCFHSLTGSHNMLIKSVSGRGYVYKILLS